MHIDETLVIKHRPKMKPSAPCLVKEINGVIVTLPSESLCRNSGRIRKPVAAKLIDLTVENLVFLNKKYGVTAEKANGTYGAY